MVGNFKRINWKQFPERKREMNHPLKTTQWALNRLNKKRASIREIMVMNNKKITNASQGKKIVSCKDLRRRFWASTLKAEVTGTMPLRFKRTDFEPRIPWGAWAEKGHLKTCNYLTFVPLIHLFREGYLRILSKVTRRNVCLNAGTKFKKLQSLS